MTDNHDPLQPHSHDPNPAPPSPQSDFQVFDPSGTAHAYTTDILQDLLRTHIPNCYIVSTGHGTSGPFTFGGVTLIDFLTAILPANTPWSQVEVISGDGFGTRIFRVELERPSPNGPILLSDEIDNHPMTREQGLLRLIVPSERDDALRQVKWIQTIRVMHQ